MSTDHLSTIFAALADPTRRAILARLASGEASVTELAEPFEMSLPAISKHLKVLERAGLIARGREAQWRPCRLEAEPLKEAADWLESYRRSGSRASIAWTNICASCRTRSERKEISMLGKKKDAIATVAVKDLARRGGSKGDGQIDLESTYKTDSSLVVYTSEFAGTNKATTVTWSVGGDFDEIVKSLQSKGVSFERYDGLPGDARGRPQEPATQCSPGTRIGRQHHLVSTVGNRGAQHGHSVTWGVAGEFDGTVQIPPVERLRPFERDDGLPAHREGDYIGSATSGAPGSRIRTATSSI